MWCWLIRAETKKRLSSAHDCKQTYLWNGSFSLFFSRLRFSPLFLFPCLSPSSFPVSQVDGVPVTPEPSSASTTSTLEPDASVPPETLSPTTTPTPSETLSPVDVSGFGVYSYFEVYMIYDTISIARVSEVVFSRPCLVV